MRENSFDIEGTKRKIRNFLRQEISKRPEMVERWNAIMNDDVVERCPRLKTWDIPNCL